MGGASLDEQFHHGGDGLIVKPVCLQDGSLRVACTTRGSFMWLGYRRAHWWALYGAVSIHAERGVICDQAVPPMQAWPPSSWLRIRLWWREGTCGLHEAEEANDDGEAL